MERAIYRWFLLALMALAQGCTPAASNTVAVPASPAEVVQARKFVLIGANGDPVAELGSSYGGAGLVLMDSTGQPRAALVLTASGEPGLKLYDQHGVVKAALMVGNDGRSGLAIYDTRGKDRAAFATDADGTPALVLFDNNGQVIDVLPAAPIKHRYRHARSK
jgi:hypothetical protein